MTITVKIKLNTLTQSCGHDTYLGVFRLTEHGLQDTGQRLDHYNDKEIIETIWAKSGIILLECTHIRAGDGEDPFPEIVHCPIPSLKILK